jgi:hypothetical protein
MKGAFKLTKTGKTIKKGSDTLIEYKRVNTKKAEPKHSKMHEKMESKTMKLKEKKMYKKS